jgi:hypothetical protein
MKDYPGLKPFFDEQARAMGLYDIPGQQALNDAKKSRAVQLIENHIGQAGRTHLATARGHILDNCEDQLASLELAFRAGCLMLVQAYQLAELPLPEWLVRYQPVFDLLLDTDPGKEPAKKASSARRRRPQPQEAPPAPAQGEGQGTETPP